MWLKTSNIFHQKLEMHQEELESLQSKSEVFETTVRKLPALEKEIAKLKEENKFLRLVPLVCLKFSTVL